MPKSMYRLPVIVAAALLLASALTWASAKTDWDKEARSRKADYIFLESMSAYAERDYDKYITLLERAYSLDSADLDIAGEWGILALIDESTDSAKADKAYDLIKRQYYAYPSNYVSGTILSNVAQRRGDFKEAVRVWETLDSLYPTRPEIALELAQAYTGAFATGDSAALDKAMAIYDRIQEGSGRSVDLSSKRMYLYYLTGDTIAAINELDSLYASAPNSSYTALYIGANYQYLDMPDETIKYYNLACELDSTNGSAYLSRAKFYNAQGDSAAFDREVFHALKSQNLDVESKIDILRSYVSELYTDSVQEPRIRQLFNELQQMHAGEPLIHTLYGSYLYEIDDYAGASEQFSYVVALDPADENAWSSYVQTSALADDSTLVLKAAREAMEKFPDNLYYPIVLSVQYRLNDEPMKALAVLDSVDVSVVNNPTAVSNFLLTKGDTYASLGDTIKALEIYDQAIELKPDNAMALNNAAYFMTLIGGDLDKAERYSAQSLKGNELNPTYLDTYAWVFFKKKDYKMAKNYIDIALNAYGVSLETDSIADGNVVVLPEIGGDAAGDPDLDEVVVEVEEDAPSADIYDHAGDIYFMNGEDKKALEFWKKAQSIDPNDEIINKKVKFKTIFFR